MPKDKENTVKINVFLTPKLTEALKAISTDYGTTVSGLVRMIVTKFVKQNGGNLLVKGVTVGDQMHADVNNTQVSNMQNRRHIFEYRGETLTLREISEKYGINYQTLYARVIKRGQSIEQALKPRP